MSDNEQIPEFKREVGGSNKPHLVSRRGLLKGTASAMPVILTLHSGAALARSSNLISAASPGTRDRLGRTLCLDTNSVYPAHDTREVYDLGEPAFARVNAITERDYRDQPKYRSNSVNESEMCRRGVPGYYKESRSGSYYGSSFGYDGYYGGRESDQFGWQKVETRGIIVSATALHSFAGHVQITEL